MSLVKHPELLAKLLDGCESVCLQFAVVVSEPCDRKCWTYQRLNLNKPFPFHINSDFQGEKNSTERSVCIELIVWVWNGTLFEALGFVLRFPVVDLESGNVNETEHVPAFQLWM
jgi:hypothetical protein